MTGVRSAKGNRSADRATDWQCQGQGTDTYTENMWESAWCVGQVADHCSNGDGLQRFRKKIVHLLKPLDRWKRTESGRVREKNGENTPDKNGHKVLLQCVSCDMYKILMSCKCHQSWAPFMQEHLQQISVKCILIWAIELACHCFVVVVMICEDAYIKKIV